MQPLSSLSSHLSSARAGILTTGGAVTGLALGPSVIAVLLILLPQYRFRAGASAE
jgi:hypothetical protein